MSNSVLESAECAIPDGVYKLVAINSRKLINDFMSNTIMIENLFSLALI